MLSVVLLLYASLTVAWPTARTAAARSPVPNVDHLMELPPPSAAQRQRDYQLLDHLRSTGFLKVKKIDQYLVAVFERGKADGFRQQARLAHAAPAPGQHAAAAKAAGTHRSLQRRAEPPGGEEGIGRGAGGEGPMYDEATVVKIIELSKSMGMALSVKLAELEEIGISYRGMSLDTFHQLEDWAMEYTQQRWRDFYGEEPPPLPPVEARRAVQVPRNPPRPSPPPAEEPGEDPPPADDRRRAPFRGGGNGNSNNFTPAAAADLLPAWMHAGASGGAGLVHRLQTTAAHLQKPFTSSSSSSVPALARWWAQVSRRAKTAAKADAPFVLPVGEF
ncbi:MAG: hypothetical protein M1826_006722 [Phylliscum demangeonii]|nr:MAG: hypothetical protein M1826_006722 [Phylliscum demangeonii]